MRNRISMAALLIVALVLSGCAFMERELSQVAHMGEDLTTLELFDIDLSYFNDLNRDTVETDIGALTDRADKRWAELLKKYAPEPSEE